MDQPDSSGGARLAQSYGSELPAIDRFDHGCSGKTGVLAPRPRLRETHPFRGVAGIDRMEAPKVLVVQVSPGVRGHRWFAGYGRLNADFVLLRIV